jgi:hypothetical protein
MRTDDRFDDRFDDQLAEGTPIRRYGRAAAADG